MWNPWLCLLILRRAGWWSSGIVGLAHRPPEGAASGTFAPGVPRGRAALTSPPCSTLFPLFHRPRRTSAAQAWVTSLPQRRSRLSWISPGGGNTQSRSSTRYHSHSLIPYPPYHISPYHSPPLSEQESSEDVASLIPNSLLCPPFPFSALSQCFCDRCLLIAPSGDCETLHLHCLRDRGPQGTSRNDGAHSPFSCLSLPPLSFGYERAKKGCPDASAMVPSLPLILASFACCVFHRRR